MGQHKKYRGEQNTQTAQTARVQKPGGARTKFIGGIVAGIVLVGAGLGIFAFLQQQNTGSASANNTDSSTEQPSNSGTPFSVSFTGSVTGPLAVSAVNLCGATEEEASTYEVDANGSINETTYSFTILILKYHGPGTYSTAGDSAAAAVSLVNLDNSTQTWVSQGNKGSAIVSSDGQSGTITATLGNPNNNKLQAQVTGTWSCG